MQKQTLPTNYRLPLTTLLAVLIIVSAIAFDTVVRAQTPGENAPSPNSSKRSQQNSSPQDFENPEERRNSFQKRVDQKRQEMDRNMEENREQVRERREQMRENGNNQMSEERKEETLSKLEEKFANRLGNAQRSLLNRLEALQNIINRLNTRLTEAEADNPSLDLSEAKNRLSEAEAKTNTIENDVMSVNSNLEFESFQDIRTEAQRIRGLIMDFIPRFREVHTDLRDAVQLAKEEIRDTQRNRVEDTEQEENYDTEVDSTTNSGQEQ